MGFRRMIQLCAALIVTLSLSVAALAQETTRSTFISPALGVQFEHPADWRVLDGRTIYLSSSESIGVWAFGAPIPPGQVALSLQVVTPPAGATAESFLAQVLSSLPAGLTAGPVNAQMLGGREAALARVDGAEAQMLVALVASPRGEFFALQGGTAPGALSRFAAAMLAVLESMNYADPAALTPSPTPITAPATATTAPTAALAGFPFRFQTPSGWTMGETTQELARLHRGVESWSFGAPLSGDQAALVMQVFTPGRVAEVTGGPADSRALLQLVLDRQPGGAEAGEIEAFTAGGRAGARALITAGDYDLLALALDVEGGRILAIQLATAPGAVEAARPALDQVLDTLALVEIQLAAGPVGATARFSGAEGGLSFDYPAGWTTRVENGNVRVGTGAAVLDWRFGAAIPAGEAVAIVQVIGAGRTADVLDLGGEANPARAFLAFALASIPDDMSVSDVQDVRLGDRRAALARIAGDDFEALALVLEDPSGDLFAMQFGAAPGELPAQEANALLIAETLARGPVTADAQPTPPAAAAAPAFEGPVETFSSVGDLFSFEYPAGWLVTDRGRTVQLGTNQAMAERQGGQPVPAGQAAMVVQFAAPAQAAAIIGTDAEPTVEALLAAILANQLPTVNFEPVQSITIGDRRSASSRGVAPDYEALLLTLSPDGQEFFFMFIVSAPGELESYRPALERVAATIGFTGAPLTMPPAPASTAGQTITAGALGFSLTYPDGWVARDSGDRLDVATRDELLGWDFSGALPAGGATLIIQTLPLGEVMGTLGVPVDRAAAALLELIIGQASDLAISPIEEMTVGGRGAAVVRAATTDFEGLILIITAPGQDMLITIQALADDLNAFEAQMLALAGSITFAGEAPGMAEAETETFTLGAYQFDYPAGWAARTAGAAAELATRTDLLGLRYGDPVPAGAVTAIVQPYALADLGPDAGTDARGFIEFSRSAFAGRAQVDAVQSITAAGRTGALVRASADSFVAVGLALDLAPGQIMTVLTLAGPGELAAAERAAQRIAESLAEAGASEPDAPMSSMAETTDATEGAFARFSDARLPYTFEYPELWYVRADEVTYVGSTRGALNASFGDLIAAGQVTITVRLVELTGAARDARGFLDATLNGVSANVEISAVEDLVLAERSAALVRVRAANSETLLLIIDARPGEVFALQLITAPGALTTAEALALRVGASIDYAR